jgi:hypothetical protein
MFGRKKKPKDAVATSARVVRMAPTAKAARQPDKLDVEFELRLSVETTAKGLWEVDLVQVVPHEKMIAVGQSVPVLASASDPNDVVIDFDTVPDAADRSRAAAAAAQAGDSAGVAEALGFELKDPPGS